MKLNFWQIIKEYIILFFAFIFFIFILSLASSCNVSKKLNKQKTEEEKKTEIKIESIITRTIMSGVDTTIIIKGDTLKTQINESVLTSGDTILTEQNGIELKQVYNKETKKLTNIVRTKNVQKNISVHKTVIENISENKKENISEKKESEVINKEVERK